MENSLIGGALVSGPNGIVDLDPCLHPHYQQPSSHSQKSDPHLQTVNHMGAFDNDSMMVVSDIAKGVSMNFVSKGNNNTSDEDEPSYDENDLMSNESAEKKGWQRMKWTDNIVRLLITIVAFIDNDASPEGMDGGKKKVGALQKKGKWKTVSKIMLEKGCYVSPQQCEDKFNDLNKRYKRLNEILGRGTTCRVVENPALLDSMTQISPKMKGYVRKILGSKQLFYREMCAYHNGQKIPDCQEFKLPFCDLPVSKNSVDATHVEEDDEQSDDFDDDLDNENDHNEYEVDEMLDHFVKGKEDERNIGNYPRGNYASLRTKMEVVLQDSTKSSWQKRDWIKAHILQLQEEKVNLEIQAFEIEQRWFKWQRFKISKNTEIKTLKLENERLTLENERQILQLRQKELKIERMLDRSGKSVNPVAFAIEGIQGRDQVQVERVQ